jgi:hypothetical protein
MGLFGKSTPGGGPTGDVPQFEELTDMLVMPLSKFKEQGRICKSTKAWRAEVTRTPA